MIAGRKIYGFRRIVNTPLTPIIFLEISQFFTRCQTRVTHVDEWWFQNGFELKNSWGVLHLFRCVLWPDLFWGGCGAHCLNHGTPAPSTGNSLGQGGDLPQLKKFCCNFKKSTWCTTIEIDKKLIWFLDVSSLLVVFSGFFSGLPSHQKKSDWQFLSTELCTFPGEALWCPPYFITPKFLRPQIALLRNRNRGFQQNRRGQFPWSEGKARGEGSFDTNTNLNPQKILYSLVF